MLGEWFRNHGLSPPCHRNKETARDGFEGCHCNPWSGGAGPCCHHLFKSRISSCIASRGMAPRKGLTTPPSSPFPRPAPSSGTNEKRQYGKITSRFWNQDKANRRHYQHFRTVSPGFGIKAKRCDTHILWLFVPCKASPTPTGQNTQQIDLLQ